MFTTLVFLKTLVCSFASYLLLGITGGTGAESYNVQDAQLSVSLALPAAASTTVTSTGIDTGETTALAVQPGNMDFLLTVPALSTTIAPNGDTITYSIMMADDVNMSVNPTALYPSVITQTGAGGVGAGATTYRFRIPSVSQRFIGFKAVSGAGITTAAALSASLYLAF
jgi:hypothetical protein